MAKDLETKIIFRFLSKGLGAVRTAGDKIKAFGARVDRLTARLKANRASTAGWLKTFVGVAALRKVINLAGEQEQAVASLDQALRNSGEFNEKYSQTLQQLASDLQALTTFGDEVTIVAIAQLKANKATEANLAKSGKTMRDLVAAVQDFAAAQRTDLVTASDLVGKTISSQTNAMSRYGIEVDANADAGTKLGQIIDGLNQKFGGRAAALAATDMGRLTQASNSLGDALEKIGAVITSVLAPLAVRLRDFLDNLRIGEGDTLKLATAVGVFAAAVTAATTVLTILIGFAGALFAKMFAISTVVGVTAAAAFISLSETSRDVVAEMIGDVELFGMTINEWMAVITVNWKLMWERLGEISKVRLAQIEHSFSLAAPNFLEFITGGVIKVDGSFKNRMDAELEAAENRFDKFTTRIAKTADAMIQEELNRLNKVTAKSRDRNVPTAPGLPDPNDPKARKQLEEQSKELARVESAVGRVSSSFASMFDTILTGTKNTSAGFRQMAANILQSISQILTSEIAQSFVNTFLRGAISNVVTGAGNIFGNLSAGSTPPAAGARPGVAKAVAAPGPSPINLDNKTVVVVPRTMDEMAAFMSSPAGQDATVATVGARGHEIRQQLDLTKG